MLLNKSTEGTTAYLYSDAAVNSVSLDKHFFGTYRELEGAFRRSVALEIILKLLDQRGGREEPKTVIERRAPDVYRSSLALRCATRWPTAVRIGSSCFLTARLKVVPDTNVCHRA
jgi:hypothetical protein